MPTRIDKFGGLSPGDVLVVHKIVTKRHTGETFPIKFFACVLKVFGKRLKAIRYVELRMQPAERDFNEVYENEDGIWFDLLAEDEYPQGVVAMRMKLIMKGVVTLD